MVLTLRERFFRSTDGIRTFANGRTPEAIGWHIRHGLGLGCATCGDGDTVKRNEDAVVRIGRGKQFVRGARTFFIKNGGDEVFVRYRLNNPSSRPIRFRFGSEMDLGLLDAHFNRVGEAIGLRRFALVDPMSRKTVAVSLSRPARVWHMPLEDVRSNGRHLERSFRGIRIACVWTIRLRPHGTWSVSMEIDSHEAEAAEEIASIKDGSYSSP